MESKDLKGMVRDKYSRIAIENKKSTCCCGPDRDSSEIYNIQTGDYSTLDGYEKDADLGLGCGLPTQYAGLQPGHTVIDLGPVRETIALLPGPKWVKPDVSSE